VARFGRRFVAQAAERLATLFQAKGFDARVNDGKVYVRRSSLGLPLTGRGDFKTDWSTVQQLKDEGVEFV
jgi:hypothetical protein